MVPAYPGCPGKRPLKGCSSSTSWSIVILVSYSTNGICSLWQAELTFIRNCWYQQFKLLISTIRHNCWYQQFELLMSTIWTTPRYVRQLWTYVSTVYGLLNVLRGPDHWFLLIALWEVRSFSLGQGLLPYTKCCLRPSSRLATIHKRYRQTDRQLRRQDKEVCASRFFPLAWLGPA